MLKPALQNDKYYVQLRWIPLSIGYTIQNQIHGI